MMLAAGDRVIDWRMEQELGECHLSYQRRIQYEEYEPHNTILTLRDPTEVELFYRVVGSAEFEGLWPVVEEDTLLW